jgi:hypothetical protein
MGIAFVLGFGGGFDGSIGEGNERKGVPIGDLEDSILHR